MLRETDSSPARPARGAPTPPVTPPRIPANELRPGRHWYAAAAATAVVSIVLAVVIGVYRFNDVVDAVDTDHPFSSGDTVTLQLGPESDKAIWVKYQEFVEPQGCSITGPGNPSLGDPGSDFVFTYDHTWNQLYTIDVQQEGTYEVVCPARVSSDYAIGESEGFITFMGWLTLAGALAVFGIGICVITVAVTALRRSNHRKRLLAEQR
ncbi:hypothetical protein AB0A74_03340 [Saccharothrix sp. NPDC042600]|uniref:hypothetical protein n=1 Tax=Saccharothrix TaxID=2071 RepID=UPI0033DE1E9A|nr:hypothetical protein GCM10017745_68120 [Saccharothrix mutabilis subsp. capreolus]